MNATTLESQGTRMMTPDQLYTQGRRVAWARILDMAARELGYSTETGRLAAVLAEREEVVAALRRACAEHGDNDWSDGANLVDVIEKHLEAYLGDE